MAARPEKRGSRVEDKLFEERICAGCGTKYDSTACRALAIHEQIEPSEIRRLVRGWPDGTAVEMRCCGRRNKAIATKVTHPSPRVDRR
jgi:hypothetical protein